MPQKTVDKKRVAVAVSGGVDSAAAALLLEKAGYEVECVVIRFSAASDKCAEEAEALCRRLSLPLSVADARREFEELVAAPFCREYCAGRTPNPCMVCNPLVKFAVLKREAEGLGCAFIATGHYARTQRRDGFYFLRKSLCAERDQSYMLARLGQEALSRLLLPLGELKSKAEARALAEAARLDCATAADSQEICFIPDGDYAEFIRRRGLKGKSGSFIAPDGEVLGPHKGTENYTVGQRRGLGLSLKAPVYVKSIEEGGDVSLAFDAELYSKEIELSDFSLNPYYETKGIPARLQAKIRSMAPAASCSLELLGFGRALLRFESAVRAPAPGQTAVLYEGELVAGSGVIERAR
ncbi:MAG: tRNA 2-thiouridine(34) synthase MnmA [Oscillospiraceae bacterium]|nr:tRNA 2-thiouridine(34) synthase MnmA [Oscillospiraceae bacterium]